MFISTVLTLSTRIALLMMTQPYSNMLHQFDKVKMQDVDKAYAFLINIIKYTNAYLPPPILLPQFYNL